MLLLRGVYQSSAAVADGRWPRAALSNGRETAGKTLGLIGFGSIGQLTAKLAKALGMDVIAFDAIHQRAGQVAGRQCAVFQLFGSGVIATQNEVDPA